MRLWDRLKRKIWREPSKEDLNAFFDRWASTIDLADEFRKTAQLMEARSLFEPILLLDGSLPESERLSRGRDFEEAYKEIFGRTMEEDHAIQKALDLYRDENLESTRGLESESAAGPEASTGG